MAWQRLTEHRLGAAGLVLIGMFALMALAHPLLMKTVWDRRTYDPETGFDFGASSPVQFTASHPLGVDAMGRDVLSRLLAASAPSLGLALLAGALAVTTGVWAGSTAALGGRFADHLITGLAEGLALLPPPIGLIMAGLIFRLDWPAVGLIYGLLAGLGPLAMLARIQVRTLAVKPFVDAARVAGAGHAHILRRHLLPAMAPFVMAHFAFTASGALLAEAAVSFFGFTGIRLSWGTMILSAQQTFRLAQEGGQWHALLPPALAVTLLAGAFHLLGDAIGQRLDSE